MLQLFYIRVTLKCLLEEPKRPVGSLIVLQTFCMGCMLPAR